VQEASSLVPLRSDRLEYSGRDTSKTRFWSKLSASLGNLFLSGRKENREASGGNVCPIMDAGMENSTDNHSDAHADHEQQKGGIGQSRGVASRPTQRCRSHFKETMKMYPTNHDEPSIDIIPHPKPLRG
jgi:hypothetical protein